MKLFTVHYNPARSDPDDQYVFVKEGFNWPAFFVPIVWLIYQRQILGIIAYLVAMSVLLGVFELLSITDEVSLVCSLGISFLIGAEANDWRRASLARSGYRVVEVVSGQTMVEAETRFFATHEMHEGSPTAHPADHRPQARRSRNLSDLGPPVLGLFPKPE